MQICKEWIKTGACTVSYCKFKHFDPNASYPSYVRPNSDNSAVDNDRPKVLRKNSKWTPVDRPIKACYQFRDFGYCKYGNRCRFEHIRPTRNYDYHKSRPSTAALKNYPKIDSMKFSQRSICFNFKNFGSCKFGNRCKYAHITDQNATLHSQQNTFLSELRGCWDQ